MFTDIIDKIPSIWKCLICDKEFDNTPYGEVPFARKTEVSSKGVRKIIGDICQLCYERRR